VNDTQFNEFAIGRPQVESAMRDQALMAWTLSGAFALSSVVRDANEMLVSAVVQWPNSQTGTYTTLVASTAFLGTVDSFKVTYQYGAGAVRTITQPTVTRDASGSVTTRPAPILS
jgi:hypothetical protein